MDNPYSISKPASEAGYFDASRGGRATQAQRVLRKIYRAKPESIALIGERRFGKTSLLHYLRFSASEIPSVHAVEVDMSSLTPPNAENFYASLTQNLIDIGILAVGHPTLSYQDFRGVLARLQKIGQRLVFFIDEFDLVAQERKFDKIFFNNLRSAGVNFPLAFVIASVKPINEVEYEEVSGSPFFNIFLEERIEQLNQREVDALISQPPCGEKGVSESAEEIIRLAGNHPYFLQLACGYSWDLREESQGHLDVMKLRHNFEKEALRQYSSIWNHYINEEQKRTLCNLTKGIQSAGPELESLIERGYVIKGDPVQICGEGFADFVKMQCFSADRDHTDKRYNGQIEQFSILARRGSNDFDVFLCYNREDSLAVRKMAEHLSKQGISPWFDEWELRPGSPWQRHLEQQIEHIKTAAVFVGKGGIGPWQEQELRAFLNEFVNRGCPVIPVLLEDAPLEPKLPVFLKAMTWVDFRIEEPDPMVRLIWGIKGKNASP